MDGVPTRCFTQHAPFPFRPFFLIPMIAENPASSHFTQSHNSDISDFLIRYLLVVIVVVLVPVPIGIGGVLAFICHYCDGGGGTGSERNHPTTGAPRYLLLCYGKVRG